MTGASLVQSPVFEWLEPISPSPATAIGMVNSSMKAKNGTDDFHPALRDLESDLKVGRHTETLVWVISRVSSEHQLGRRLKNDTKPAAENDGD
jgi:uncharacterized protein involved in exopolysaccharide biosynthesis